MLTMSNECAIFKVLPKGNEWRETAIYFSRSVTDREQIVKEGGRYMAEVPMNNIQITEEDLKLLYEVKKTATKTCDAVVKKTKDGKYNVYENKITKVS